MRARERAQEGGGGGGGGGVARDVANKTVGGKKHREWTAHTKIDA